MKRKAILLIAQDEAAAQAAKELDETLAGIKKEAEFHERALEGLREKAQKKVTAIYDGLFDDLSKRNLLPAEANKEDKPLGIDTDLGVIYYIPKNQPDDEPSLAQLFGSFLVPLAALKAMEREQRKANGWRATIFGRLKRALLARSQRSEKS